MSVKEQPGDKIIFAWATDAERIDYKLCSNGVGYYLVRVTPRLNKIVARYDCWNEAVKVIPEHLETSAEEAHELFS